MTVNSSKEERRREGCSVLLSRVVFMNEAILTSALWFARCMFETNRQR